MSRGLVYEWTPDASLPLGGSIDKRLVDLGALAFDGKVGSQLRNALVEVRNGGRRNRFDPKSGLYENVAVGNAEADSSGDFIFESGKGGGRLDKNPFTPEDFQWRYMQASHFGEVNTFYHLNKIATYIDGLLRELGKPPLPVVITVVNAHHGVKNANGVKDGLCNDDDCRAFQGGHYRLPARKHSIVEHHPVAVEGEIHLGPGRQLVDSGALVELARCSYRANASHNAGIIYHEYGHHITCHTADFRANRLRPADFQDNRKAAIDEGISDYWAATMLATPHIWAFHKRHDASYCHPRSLVSQKTMNDFDSSAKADPHLNGTIWGAALWDMRTEIMRMEGGSARKADLLVIKMLTLTASVHEGARDIKLTRKLRSKFQTGLEQLLQADAKLFGGRYTKLIQDVFARRKIFEGQSVRAVTMPRAALNDLSDGLRRLPPEDIPDTVDILSASSLSDRLESWGESDYSVIGSGDIMLGDRTTPAIREFGEDYPFAGVLPLLKRSRIVLGNIEGPFASEAQRQDRNFSYRVRPKLAFALKRANINVVTLANNHLQDCGRQGVLETFDALAKAGVHAIGAGRDEASAHAPVILDAGSLRVGILGYYWNKRTAATSDMPGSAIDTPEYLKADIEALRHRVDRVVVTCHWGVPYDRVPNAEDRSKARLAVDLGADLVIGHHPHVMQPFEVYNGKAIFYSVGNFTFGSGNSKAEGLLVAARFEQQNTIVDVYPIYVKNRDPRVNYQPKILVGETGSKLLSRLAGMSDASGDLLSIDNGVGRLQLPHLQRIRAML